VATAVPKLAAAKPWNRFVCNNLQQHKIRQIQALAGIGRPQPKLVVFGQGWAALAKLSESTTAREYLIASLLFHNRKRPEKGLYSSLFGLGCRASPPYLSLSRAREFAVAA